MTEAVDVAPFPAAPLRWAVLQQLIGPADLGVLPLAVGQADVVKVRDLGQALAGPFRFSACFIAEALLRGQFYAGVFRALPEPGDAAAEPRQEEHEPHQA